MTPAITQPPPSASSSRRSWPGCWWSPPAWVRCLETPPEGRAGLQPQVGRLELSCLAMLTMCVRCAPSPARTDADGPNS